MKYDFDTINLNKEKEVSKTQYSGIRFFSLKDDGDTAIVRFPYQSSKDFDVLSVHTVKVGKMYKNVNCLFDEDVVGSTCPFCQASEDGSMSNAKKRFFVKMIVYETTADGKITVSPRIWERPLKFAAELKEKIADWGDAVFKIKRVGKSGDQSTQYIVTPCKPEIYRDDIYVKDFSAFENYSVDGRYVLNKTREEMITFLETGEFPVKQYQKQSTTNQYTNQTSTQQQTIPDKPATKFEANRFATTTAVEPANIDMNNVPRTTVPQTSVATQATTPTQETVQTTPQRRYYDTTTPFDNTNTTKITDPTQTVRPRKYDY